MSRPITAVALAAGLLAFAVMTGAPVRPARAATDAAQDWPDTVEVDAFTIPYRQLEIPGEIGGVLVSMTVEEGDEVVEGELLAEFRGDQLRARLAVAQARTDTADAQINAAVATSEVADTEYERAITLNTDGLITDQELLKTKLDAKVAKLNIDVAEVEKRVRELEVEQSRTVLDRTIVRAPIDGLVFRIDKRAGEAVEIYKPILSMVSLDPLYVVANVPVRTTGRIQVGMAAALRLETSPEEELECTVEIVDRVADAASGFYRIKLTLPNPDSTFIAGARGTVTFKLP